GITVDTNHTNYPVAGDPEMPTNLYRTIQNSVFGNLWVHGLGPENIEPIIHIRVTNRFISRNFTFSNKKIFYHLLLWHAPYSLLDWSEKQAIFSDDVPIGGSNLLTKALPYQTKKKIMLMLMDPKAVKWQGHKSKFEKKIWHNCDIDMYLEMTTTYEKKCSADFDISKMGVQGDKIISNLEVRIRVTRFYISTHFQK
ncbi:hypothetical protein ACJX0J_008567, partial [Zea mays]